MKKLTIAAAIAATLTLALAACSPATVAPPAPPTAEPAATQEPAEEAVEEVVEEPVEDELGTRSNPIAYDEWAYVENTINGDPIWDIKVGAPFDGTADIANENQFNDPPAADHIYLAIPVTIVYQGEDKITPWVDFQNGIDIAFVSSDGVTYEEEFVVQPWPGLMDVSDLYTGGSADFVTVVQVPVGASGLVRVGAGQFDYFVGNP